jgi:hypothetical protein
VLLIGKKIELIGMGIVTNLSLPSRAVVPFYNKRGAAEQWIQEPARKVPHDWVVS